MTDGEYKPCVGIDAFRLVGQHTSINTYTLELIDALGFLGYPITLFSPRREPGSSLEELPDHKVVATRFSEYPLQPEIFLSDLFRWNQFVLPSMLRKTQVDVLISPYHQVPCFLPMGVRTISVVHDLCGLRKDCGYRPFGRAYFRHYFNLLTAALTANAIIPISHATRDAFVRRFPFSSARVSDPIYNQVSGRTLEADEARLTLAPLGVPPPGFVLGFGIVGPRKGLDIALAGYRQYRSNGGNQPLVLIGEDNRERIQQQLPESLWNLVHFLPRVSNCERDSLYRLAGCLLYCSRCEGFGYPMVEAMRQGCPVIALKGTPATEIASGVLDQLDTADAACCAVTISKFTTMSETARAHLAKRLIERSSDFCDGTFGDKFAKVIKSVAEYRSSN